MIARVVILSIIVSSVFTQADEGTIFRKYQEYLTRFQKNYGSLDEMTVRYDVFKNNYLAVLQLNGGTEVQVTKFMGMTPNEFQRRLLTLDVNHTTKMLGQTGKIHVHPMKEFQAQKKGQAWNAWRFGASPGDSDDQAPASWDWRKQGAVGKVREQGECGACWTFSSVANIEGLYFIKYNKLLSFSQQHLLDCDNTNGGCGGGAMEDAFKWIKSNGGIQQYGAYPYTGVKGQCKQTNSKTKVKVKGWKMAGTTNEEVIKDMLYQHGPLSVAINAKLLQWYSGGIIDYSKKQCDPEGTDHAVNLVGYGSENGKPYWIVKNSWGADWGENGYMRVARGKGTCGINTYVVTASLN